MKPEPQGVQSPGRGHLDGRTALDYLDRLLGADERKAVEEHLGLPCPACHERVRTLGLLVQRMRLDRAIDVPESLRARAREVFVPAEHAARGQRLVERLARLVFDSWTDPLPAAARRATGDARRMRFALDEGLLELECERESQGMVTLRGQLETQDAALHRVEVAVGAERLTAWPDAAGRFALDGVPAGPALIVVLAPSGRFRLPSLTL